MTTHRAKAPPLALSLLALLGGCPSRGQEPGKGEPAASARPAVSAAPAASASAAGRARLEPGCTVQGPGKVWRLRGTLGNRPAEGDAVRIGGKLWLALSSKGRAGFFEGPIDAQGNFDLSRPGQAIASLRGKLDADGTLTGEVPRLARGAPTMLVMNGSEEKPGPQPRLVTGYAVATRVEGDMLGSPVSETSVQRGIVALGVLPGTIGLIDAGEAHFQGACLPGSVAVFEPTSPSSKAQVTAAASALVPGAKVLASEVFEGRCGRDWRDLDVWLLVDRKGQRELVEVQAREGDLPGASIVRQRAHAARCP